jgi:hypothetical protein
MTHYHVKYTGRGTIWHNARWKALIMVPYDTLPGERHWSWYHMPNCQARGTGRGTICHIARGEALVVVLYDTLPGARHWSWYHMPHCQVRGTGRGTVWQRLTHDHVGNENKISINSEPIKVFDNMYAFLSIGNARLHTSMWLITLLGLTWHWFFCVVFYTLTTNLLNFVSIDNNKVHHIEGIC